MNTKKSSLSFIDENRESVSACSKITKKTKSFSFSNMLPSDSQQAKHHLVYNKWYMKPEIRIKTPIKKVKSKSSE